jgi:hypothetical protein
MFFAKKLLQGVNGTQRGKYCDFRKLRGKLKSPVFDVPVIFVLSLNFQICKK